VTSAIRSFSTIRSSSSRSGTASRRSSGPQTRRAFDRRLAEIGVLFASIGRQPHFWDAAAYGRAPDLISRLIATGSRTSGTGWCSRARMSSRHAPPCVDRRSRDDVVMERFGGIVGADASRAADLDRRGPHGGLRGRSGTTPRVVAETLASLADHASCTTSSGATGCRWRGSRATFDGISYLLVDRRGRWPCVVSGSGAS
jgi:hypothetical protein